MAKNTKKILALMVGVLMAVIFMGPIVTIVDGNTGTQSVVNESVTADAGNYTDLVNSDLNQDTVTVEYYNETSGSYETATEGTDYEIDLDAGEIQVLESSPNIDDGDELLVDYEYQATSGTNTLILGFVPLVAAVAIVGRIGIELNKML